MSLRKWRVREYRPEDASALQELFAKVFHQTRPIEHFIWKFHDNPAGRGIITLAEHHDRIVGQHALMPTKLRLGREIVLGAQSVDAMTHPDYRNQGMFVALAKACMQLATTKGVEALYAFPNQRNPSYHGFVYRLNWDHTDDIPVWVRVLNPRTLESISRPIGHLALLGISLLPMGNSAPHGVDIRMERPASEELASLAGLASKKEDGMACRIDRSIDWFNWRFDLASQRRYVWFSAYRGGNLQAWAVFGVNEWGGMPLIDMSGVDHEALVAVVSSATHHAKELGLPALIACTNDDDDVRALKSCGYFRRRSLALTVRSLTSRILDGNTRLHTSWHITSEDLDTF